MNFQIALLLCILAAALALFSWERIAADVVALGVLLALVFTGLLPKDKAFDGFGSDAVIMILGLAHPHRSPRTDRRRRAGGRCRAPPHQAKNSALPHARRDSRSYKTAWLILHKVASEAKLSYERIKFERSNMKIGIIGAGEIGGTLTRRLTALGHQVSVANSRGPEIAC